MLRDENGITLKPSHASKSGRRYRYYISRTPEDGSSATASGWRLPAPAIENLVVHGIVAFLDDGVRLTEQLSFSDLTADQLKSMLAQAARMKRRLEMGNRAEMRAVLCEVVARIELRQHLIRIGLNATAMRVNLDVPDRSDAAEQSIIWHDIPVQLRRRGAELKLVLSGEHTRAGIPDPNLIAAIAQAHRWFEELCNGGAASIADLVRRHGMHQADISRILPLAFLAPDIVEAILDGRQPVELTAARLKRIRLPHAWADQRRVLGFVG